MERPEIKVPSIPVQIIEYLEESFRIDSLLSKKTSNNDEQVGFIKGVREVVGHLRTLHNEQNGAED
jgi:hypothetical protein